MEGMGWLTYLNALEVCIIRVHTTSIASGALLLVRVVLENLLPI